MRKTVMSVVPLITSLLFLLMSVQVTAQVRDPNEYFFSQMLGDLTEELEIAKEGNKKGVIIMFEDDDCPFCERMKKTVLNQSEVQDYYRKNFHILPIDVNGDVEITDFDGNSVSMKDFSTIQHRVRATPVFGFFTLDGKPVKRGRYTGAMTGVEEFMQYGQYLSEGIYEKASFTRYKRALKKAEKK